MENDLSQQLSIIQKKILSLKYRHPEGGKYPYVLLLTYLRDLPVLLRGCGRDELARVLQVSSELNRRLGEKFTDAEERFFELGKAEVIRVINARLACLAEVLRVTPAS